jgi:hypothetical protein
MASHEVKMTARAATGPIILQLRLTGVRRMVLRFWLAGLLFKLGAMVAGCQAEVVIDPAPRSKV